MNRRRLRGRDAETAALRDLLDLVGRSGAAALGLVHGEPGIGKTALLDAVLDGACGRGLRVSRGKAEESDQIAPLSSLLEALRGLIGPAELKAVPSREDQHFWAVEQLAALIEARAEQAPIIIAIDDLQWVDPLSRLALRMLPSRLRGSPVCWLMTSRDGAFTHVEQIVAAAAGALPVGRVELTPLPAAVMRDIAADVLRRPADPQVLELLDGAGGNPFLAVELLEGLGPEPGAAPPQRLVLGVRHRLRALPPAALALLRAGAVLGRRFALPEAQAVLDLDVTALTADLDGLLDDDGERLEFRHDLIRQAVYADIPPSARSALHRAAAGYLHHTARRPVDAARHLMAGAALADDDGIDLQRAVAQSIAEPLPGLAADLLVRSMDSARPDEVVTERAIRLLVRAHRHRDAVSHADGATPAILAAVGRSLWELQRAAELERRTVAALADSGLTALTRVQLNSLHALALSRGEDRAYAWRAAEAALAAAEELGDEQAVATALLSLGETAFSEGFNQMALDYFHRLRELDPTVLTWEILIHQHLDDFDTAARLIAEARAECERPGSKLQLAAVLWVQACQSFLLGRLEDLDAELVTLAELDGDGLPDHAYSVVCRVGLSRNALLRGRLPEARRWLAEARNRLTDAPDPGDLAAVRLNEAWLADADGDPLLASEILRKQRVDDAWMMRTRLLRPWAVSTVEIALRGRDPGLAAELADQTMRYADRNPGAVTAAGIGAHAAGLAGHDLERLDRAVTILADSPRRLIYARALTDSGRALLRVGRRSAAVRRLVLAAQVFAEHGAEREAGLIEAMLRSQGVSRPGGPAPADRPDVGWAALTPTEMRVARMVAAGHSNRSAAAELGISPHTVNTHLGAVFRKLQVSSRVQLAKLVADG